MAVAPAADGVADCLPNAVPFDDAVIYPSQLTTLFHKAGLVGREGRAFMIVYLCPVRKKHI